MGQINRGEFVEAGLRFLSVMGLYDALTLDNFELLSDLRYRGHRHMAHEMWSEMDPRKLADFIRTS